MMSSIKASEFFLWAQSRMLIDLRSESSFKKGSLEGALNVSAEGKSREDLLRQIRKSRSNHPLHLMDYRGQLSKELASELGCQFLEGGYHALKQWREEEAFSGGPPLLLLGGYTGSGKSILLQQLQFAGHQVLDLEKLASHKGSAFGYMPETSQPSHEWFQNHLLQLWLSFSALRPVWVEEKGPFLGRVGLPPSLYSRMQSSRILLLDVPFDDRLNWIRQSYHDLQGNTFRKAIKSLESRMGMSQNHKALHFHDTGQRLACLRILLKYYDQAYEKRRENSWGKPWRTLSHRHDQLKLTLKHLQELEQKFLEE